MVLRLSAFFATKLQALGFYSKLYSLVTYYYLYLTPSEQNIRICMVASSITDIMNQEIYAGTNNKFVYNVLNTYKVTENRLKTSPRNMSRKYTSLSHATI